MGINKFSSAALPDLSLFLHALLPNVQHRFETLTAELFQNENTLESLYFPKSWMSLSFMISLLKKEHSINLIVPELFCDQTLNNLPLSMDEITYYRLDDKLNPFWGDLKEKCHTKSLNIIILVHYFGYEFDFDPIKTITSSYSCFIVEDCAHQLMPSETMGGIGDMVLFSPHKHIPVDYGAICLLNNTSLIKKQFSLIHREYAHYLTTVSKKVNWKWFLIRYFQRFLPYFIYSKLKKTKHKSSSEERECLSQLSRFTISANLYYLKKIHLIKKLKCEHYKKIERQLKTRFPDFKAPSFGEKCHIPFYFSFFLPASIQTIMGFLPVMAFYLFWPDLPDYVKENKSFQISLKYSTECYHLPIHHTQEV